MNKKIHPFLKWAGGKRWFVENYHNLLPKDYNNYFEPFLGSGAVFFHLHPHTALLSDTNFELINTYTAIKNDWRQVYAKLCEHQQNHCKDYYYLIRGLEFSSQYERAARFLYLNRTCWNGLYRVNMKGYFNVPIGTKETVLLNTDDFARTSYLLSKVELVHSDFEEIIDRAKECDFLFVDPPYTVKHNENNFVKYNEKIFKWEDQVRLSKCLIRAHNRKVKIAVTNACHPSIYALYKAKFKFRTLSRQSVLAATAKHRRMTTELLITNY